MHRSRQEYLLYRAKTMHPIAQIIAALATVLMLGALFFLGLVFFAVFAGVAMLFGLGLWLRIKWLRWRHGQPGTVERMTPQDKVTDALEGEFVVVEQRQDRTD